MNQASIGTTSRHWPARMRRTMASAYLFEVHGVKLSPATMAKQAVLGGGCPFRLDGRFPLYDLVELDAYAVARLGPLRRSTSDEGQPLAAWQPKARRQGRASERCEPDGPPITTMRSRHVSYTATRD